MDNKSPEESSNQNIENGERKFELPIDIGVIEKLIPHRYPFLLIDRITDYEPFKTIKAYKNVTINEPFFQGHFPQYKVMPGVLVIEAMAQVAGMLSILSLGGRDESEIYFFVGIDKARFKRQVVPGDRLEFEMELLNQRSSMAKFKGVAMVDGKIAAEAEIMCAKRKMED